ncbi:kinesin-like protein KIF2C isoform X2 [Salmo salar]|uniref:Kinesin-like protein n=1 Tax=Salmo salar TaxID=8030 RepID=A0A1S3LX59_SALSA|nr:kinesin-like protein KIF2C isoform X2 [Salmo salar]|eukprot:XP_013995548.1 PREDICTED: kinesin-like protein KIF2C isoform X2 [Salmo salar]
MDSTMANLLVGLSVNIQRSDGRVHPANVKTVDSTKRTVMVEWFEKSVCRGKELEMNELWSLNKELFEHMKPANIPALPEKKFESRLRSSGVPPPSSLSLPRKSTRQTCLFRTLAPVSELAAKTKHDSQSSEYPPSVLKASGVPNRERKRNSQRPTAVLPPVNEALKENEAKSVSSVTSSRRRSVLPQDMSKPVNKRLSNAVKSLDMVPKKGKFEDTNRPNKQFYQMIEEFRETLEVLPLSLSDTVEAHRICVCVRKRPLNNKEVTKKDIDVVSIPGNGTLLLHEPKQKVDLTKYLDNQVFHFDYSFDESSTNDLVYRFTAKPLVQTIFDGGMATCFAYGQTGSGKTHTMGGDFSGKSQNSAKGIYAMAAQDVFALLKQRRYSSLDLCPYVTFFEIYNSKVFDLLNKKAKLRVLEDEKQQVQVVGLQEMYVSCAEDVIKMIEMGSACRTSGQTSANANSSRSHAILQVILRRRNQVHGKFSLVDLAGNERGIDVRSSNRQTLVETAEINRSLLALKECIRSLGMDSHHIPFRMSKLTQVLRDSFIGENSRTCMIAMVSPGMSSCDSTVNTLRYADRVKELNGTLKMNDADLPKNIDEMEVEDSSSSEEDSIVPMTDVYEAISQVSELEERVHEELTGASNIIKLMEMPSYDIEAGATDIVDYARKLLDTVLALQSAIDGERLARMSPKSGYC